MAIIGREFDPEFDSGCETCGEEFPIRELYYHEHLGHYQCPHCYKPTEFHTRWVEWLGKDVLEPVIVGEE